MTSFHLCCPRFREGNVFVVSVRGVTFEYLDLGTFGMVRRNMVLTCDLVTAKIEHQLDIILEVVLYLQLTCDLNEYCKGFEV